VRINCVSFYSRTTLLSDYFCVSVGIDPYGLGSGTPPQAKEIIDSRAYDGYKKIDETWLEYQRGKTIGRYSDQWDGEYIKYGEWLRRPKKREVFERLKLFIRQTGDYPIAMLDNNFSCLC